MSSMGVKIDQFDIPVCNSFQAKILNDQLCYEVDLSRFTHKDISMEELKSGLTFILDYNIDRQVYLNDGKKNVSMKNHIVESDHEHHASIHLDTVGKVYRV